MKNHKFIIGNVAQIFGSLLLAIELFGLKVIQMMGIGTGQCYINALDYTKEPEIGYAMVITVGVMIYGFVLIITSDKIWLRKQLNKLSDKAEA